MAEQQVSIQVLEGFETLVSEERLRGVLEKTLSLEPIEWVGGVGLVIAGDETVRQLNRDYRGLDETTDVLSFSPVHAGEYYGEENQPSSLGGDEAFILPPGENPPLGEIIISYPQAQRQARESGHLVEQELTLLIVHGVLHLIGYDHEVAEEEKLMMEKQSQILARLLTKG